MFHSIPNLLTLSRILFIPIIIASFYFEDSILAHRIAAGLFIIAGITDFLDGYFARMFSIESSIGKLLDPIADKLLVGSVILMLVHFNRIDILPALAIICREILVSGLREFLAELQVSLPVSRLAKLKTTLQIIAIFLLLLATKGSTFAITDLLARVAIWLAAGLTIFTGYAYFKSAIIHISKYK